MSIHSECVVQTWTTDMQHSAWTHERINDKSVDGYYLHLTAVSVVWYVNFPFRHYEAEKDAWEDPNH